MQKSHIIIIFLVSTLLENLEKEAKLSGMDFDYVVSILKKSLGSAYVTHEYDFSDQAQMVITIDRNKLDCSIESVEEVADLIRSRIVRAHNVIENSSEDTRLSKLTAANQLVKLSGKLGNVVDQRKCAEYEESYKPVESVLPGLSRSSMAFNSAGHPCITTLSVRYDGQDINCSIDEDTLDEIRDVLIGYQNGDVKVFDVSIEGLKNKLGKYKDVKLVGLEQS